MRRRYFCIGVKVALVGDDLRYLKGLEGQDLQLLSSSHARRRAVGAQELSGDFDDSINATPIRKPENVRGLIVQMRIVGTENQRMASLRQSLKTQLEPTDSRREIHTAFPGDMSTGSIQSLPKSPPLLPPPR